MIFNDILIGGLNPSENILISQLGSLFRNIRKVIKAYKSHVPNHQPVLNDIPSGYLT